MPIAVDGVTFGGSDGRRAILPGEEEAREDWILCDGGSDGKGGTVPDLRGSMIMGASDAYAAGSTGGTAEHTHPLSGSVGATTLSEAQLAAHTHSTPAALCGWTGQFRYGANNQLINNVAIQATPAGASQPHTHPLSGASGQASTLPPYYALAYIMRVA